MASAPAAAELPGFAAVLGAANVAECTAAFRAVANTFDIDTFASGEIDLRHAERSVFYVIDWPQDWRDFYFASNFVERDPLLPALEIYGRPFTWREMRHDRRLAAVGTEAIDRMNEAGWLDGLVIGLPRGGSRYGLVSLVSRSIVEEALRTMLVALGIAFHEKVRSMVRRDGFALPPVGLTPRELGCVALVAKGRSDRMIAAELGLSPATAHEYVERAKSRLKVSTRAELAALAVSLGLVEA